MTSNSSLTQCPHPFIAELAIGDDGGYLPGRWCTSQTIGDEAVSCCFPCPFTDWQYAHGFREEVVPWIALVVLVLMLTSALTFIVLPVSDTQRHYLTSSPLMGFIFMSIAFIIPLGSSDHHCHDAITPNHWLSDNTCAVTGSFILYGVWVLVIGCFFRSLFLYLQLMWDVEPGKRFRIFALLCIFAGSAGLLGLALGVSGVSYQVGDMCYISHPHSVGSFWGPLIGIAFVSFAIQIFIMVHCIRGVITKGGTTRFSIFKRSESDSLSRAAAPPPHVSRKIRQILQLQWRAIAIAFLVLLYVVYVAQAVLRYGDPARYSHGKLQPWVDCLVQTRGDKEACSDEAVRIGPNRATAVSALALLASCGVWGVICTARWSMVLGWLDWAYDRKDDLVSLIRRDRRDRLSDLERVSSDAQLTIAVNSPATLDEVDRLYGTRKYHVPQGSFSRPGRTSTMNTFDSSTGTTITGSTMGSTVTTVEGGFDLTALK